MKRFLALCTSLLLTAALLCGCADSASRAAPEEEKLSVVATIFPPYDFARQILGGAENLTMLLRPGQEVHSYEPTPQDIITLQNCDLFIYVGGESDAWIDDVLSGMDTSRMKIVSLMDAVETLEEDSSHVLETEEETDGEEETEYDEHVWTSPKNAQKITQAVCDALAEIDSKNAEAYQANTAAYLSELEKLDSSFRQVVAESKRDTLIFGDRFPLLYFVREYGLNYYAAFPGCSSETEPSAQTVARLTDLVREQEIPVVFSIELSSGNIARCVAESSGAQVRTFYTCHTVTADDFRAGETYLSLMQKNVETLKEALS